MRKFCSFWWGCLLRARGGSAAFGNDWQWLIGAPVLAFVLWFGREYLNEGTQELLSGKTALGAVLASFVVFLITMVACFVIRLFIWPPILFHEEKDRADRAEKALKDELSPRIKVFLDPDWHGVTEVPTRNTATGQAGPSSKWIQVSVAGATQAPIADCEAWLTSARRIDNGVLGAQLVEEHIHCHWSQREPVKEITLRPLVIQRANLFSVHQDPLVVKPETNPMKIRLLEAIQQPGQYQLQILVTAQGSPSIARTFIFEWRNFKEVFLTEA
jgi:hypothetical protein